MSSYESLVRNASVRFHLTEKILSRAKGCEIRFYPNLIREGEKKPIRIFLEDTLNDNRNANNPTRDWHLQNEAMVAAFKEKGYDMKHVFDEGVHSDAHGGSIMPEMLRWLWRDYPK